MKLLAVENWLKAPADRDVIAHWTVGANRSMGYALTLPPPPDPDCFEFLALGDSGDAASSGSSLAPQDGVAEEMARDAALPESAGRACFVVHLGDVVYMTGEHRLYDRNFRRPYEPFLAPESTIEDLRFRLPFLPVPGNHDYYDLGGWGRFLARVPFLGTGLRAIAHELFAFSLPEGGSDMGRAYMEAFVDAKADTSQEPLLYQPGKSTRLPNRYYRFRVGSADFFALDSNTLDAPPPWVDPGPVRLDAARRIEDLEARARVLDVQLRRSQQGVDQWVAANRAKTAADPDRLAALAGQAGLFPPLFARLQEAVQVNLDSAGPCAGSAATSLRRWEEAVADLAAASAPGAEELPRLHALESLEEASDAGCAALSTIEDCLGPLPEGPARRSLLALYRELEERLRVLSDAIGHPPVELCSTLHQASEEALDVQRDLATERRRVRYRPEDHDAAQFQWLEAALNESVSDRPDGWRIVYLHHPLYTTIANHCEGADVLAIRENLLGILRDRVDLVLSGHSHSFEWFRSSALPHTGIFVTGGGGQISLRRSLLDPQILSRRRHRYENLRNAGVAECATAGRGPAASDGESGSLYHYLKIEVTPQSLRVRPIGVRRLGGSRGAYRREDPMPVYHSAALPETRPSRKARLLEGVVIRRGMEPQAVWG